MAYSRIEQAYLDSVVDYQFPDPVIEEPQQEQPMMLADSGQVKSDAQGGFGTIGPIPRNRGQEALGYVGELLTKAGVQLDKVGLDIPMLGRITLKDLTVGESGKVLEDMSYGFMPVEGGGNFISGTKRIKPDAALELMNIAPAVGAAVKLGGKAAVKGVTKAVEATKGLPVGMSVKPVGQGVDELGFYSAATKAVDNIQQPKGTGSQFLAQIEKTPGVKPEEIKWTGLDDFLKSKKSVTKQEVQEYMAANRVGVQEVKLGAPTHEWQGNFLVINKTAVAKLDEAADGSYVLRDNINETVTPLKSNRLDKAVAEAEDIYGVKGMVTPYEGKPKFDKYTLPGGENYREILLTLPDTGTTKQAQEFSMEMYQKYGTPMFRDKLTPDELAKFDELNNTTQPFKSGHFDQPNILAHFRVNDRVDADGKKVLFVEEVQSDWHQAGRKKGYQTKLSKEESAELEALYKKEKEGDGLLFSDDADRLTELENKSKGGVPDAPFKTTWHELALKRAIQMAAEGGYDRIAFTTGAQQAARYDLSKQVKMISAMPDKNGKYNIYIEGKDGDPVFRNTNGFSEYGQKTVTPEEFEELVGKDAAKTIMQKADELNRGKVSKDQFKFYDSRPEDLIIGGEGMKGFYDNIVPKFLDKYGKKWDAKTGMTKIRVATDKQAAEDAQLLNELGVSKDSPNAMANVHYIDITPKMKESVLTQGQPLFAIGAGGAGAAMQQEENK